MFSEAETSCNNSASFGSPSTPTFSCISTATGNDGHKVQSDNLTDHSYHTQGGLEFPSALPPQFDVPCEVPAKDKADEMNLIEDNS